MSTKNKTIDNGGHNAKVAAMPLDNINDEHNTSYHEHTNHNSSTSSESEISLLNLSFENELEANGKTCDIDELPAFEIRLISPLGRTPSPIDSEDAITPVKAYISTQERVIQNACQNNPEFVALHDLNAQISPPSDSGEERDSSLSRTSSLETIYEGVFLNTPPRQHSNLQNRMNRSRTNLLEKVVFNRLNMGKENHSPLSRCEIPNSRRKSIDFRGAPDSFAVDENHSFS